MAQSAAADIRQAGGRAARDTETTRAVLDAESQKISRLDDNEKLRLIDYIETRSKEGTAPLRADLMPVADAVKQSMDLRRAKIEKLDSAEKALWRMMSFYDTPLADLDAASAHDPGWALPHVMRAGFLLSLTEAALLPEAEIVSRPRFSTLSHSGAKKLSRIPPRSAIVALPLMRS